MSIAKDFSIDDRIGAWVPHGRFTLPGAAQGPLKGLTFAVKDLFDVAGHPTGAGNPSWLATHAVPAASNPIVESLLQAGADLVGKTLTDELAYSIHGDNTHYGTPLNAAAPGRVPGGSSSGSAAAVAAKLCDFALGTDTGGSTRVPASYCGIWGLRTTHDLLPRQGLVPLSPGFDTPTWFAHESATFARVADVLLPAADASMFKRGMVFEDALEQADPQFQAQAAKLISLLAQRLPVQSTRISAPGTLEDWRRTYLAASGYEAWQTHGAWIEEHKPTFGAAIDGRWKMARAITPEAAQEANAATENIRAHVRAILGADGIAVLPSAASAAPLLDASPEEIDAVRTRCFRITCIAGLSGLPQVSIPFIDSDGLPFGISLLGPAGSDRALVALAISLYEELQQS